MNICQHFFIVIHAKMPFIFGLLLCKISFEKNQLLNVSGLEFTYNNWQKKKELSDAYLTCIYICIEQGNCCGSLPSPVKRLNVKLFIMLPNLKTPTVISNMSVLKHRDSSCDFLRPLIQLNC